MCGITGFIDFKKKSGIDILQSMTNTLFHRGPDGSGFELINHSNAQVGFGHRRLSIIDLSEQGKQPMQFEHLWICFNGEVYNYTEIKKELLELGHSFLGNSDTEVIIHSFAQWGEKCIDRFIGMFAFVIYDSQKEKVFCVRDRAGVKPFFYYYQDGLFLFSSELKSFHKHPRFKKELNKRSVAAFMQYGNVPTPHCIFRDCFKLKPGHSITFSLTENNMDAAINPDGQTQYWNVYDAYNKPKLTIDFETAKRETEDLLSSASCKRKLICRSLQCL